MLDFTLITVFILFALPPLTCGLVATKEEDLLHCKVTAGALDYNGIIRRTKSGRLCQHWERNTPNQIPTGEQDVANFPDVSLSRAKNYCRQPNIGEDKSPWCYTLHPVGREDCDVPFCEFRACRVTGTGQEYAGDVSRTVSGASCIPWSTLPRPPPDKEFPDGSAKQAGSHCRNPEAQPQGPFCYIGENAEDWEPCNIPFCNRDDEGCTIATSGVMKDNQPGQFFIDVDETKNNWNVSIRAWTFKGVTATAVVALRAMAIPSPKENVIEIVIGKKDGILNGIRNISLDIFPSTLTRGTYDLTRRRISHLKWLHLHITLHSVPNSESMFVSVRERGDPVNFATYEVPHQVTLPFSFISVYTEQAAPFLWRVNCNEDQPQPCQVLTTIDDKEGFFRRLQQRDETRVLEFHVRAMAEGGKILLRRRIDESFRSCQILLELNSVTVSCTDGKVPQKFAVDKRNLTRMFHYFEWSKYILTISSSGRMKLVHHTMLRATEIFRAKHDFFKSVVWFGVHSFRHAVVHWIFQCSPNCAGQYMFSDEDECGSGLGTDYEGRLYVTQTGKMCEPWNSIAPTNARDPDKDYKFPESTSAEENRNYCRNPDATKGGLWCYTIVKGYMKESCQSKKCDQDDCKLCVAVSECLTSLIGDMYEGNIATSRSGFACLSWADVQGNVNTGEMDLEKAGSFCRNPDNRLGGPWCVTANVSTGEVCLIPECSDRGGRQYDKYDPPIDRERECVIFTHNKSSDIMAIPLEWRQTRSVFWLRSWDWDNDGGAVIQLRDSHYMKWNENKMYEIEIGAAGLQEARSAIYSVQEGVKTMLKEKLVTRYISTGAWSGFWVQAIGGRIQLGRLGNVLPLLEHWDHTNSKFVANFITFSSGRNNPLAWNLGSCDTCIVMITRDPEYTTYFPIHMWSGMADDATNHVIQLYVRGKQGAKIAFYQSPDGDYLELTIDAGGESKTFLRLYDKNGTSVVDERSLSSNILDTKRWKQIDIRYTGESLVIQSFGEELAKWTGSYFPVWWVSLASEPKVSLYWAFSCPDPPDLDEEPRDGGWSDWSEWRCSVTCGGGTGVRTRNCTNPTPGQLFGAPCMGKDEMVGRCNEFQCGDASREVMKELRKRLTEQARNKDVDVGNPVTLTCPSDIIATLKSQSPESKIFWMKNAVHLSEEDIKANSRLTMAEDHSELKIWPAEPEDTGLYVCTFESARHKRTAVEVIAVVVRTTNETHSAIEGDSFDLKCNGEILGLIYNELQLRWFLNDNLHVDYGIVLPHVLDTETLDPVAKDMAGVWTCEVTQVDLQLKWVTSWIRLQVQPSPTIFHTLQNLSEPAKAAIIICIVGLVLITFIACHAKTIVSTFYKLWTWSHKERLEEMSVLSPLLSSQDLNPGSYEATSGHEPSSTLNPEANE